MPRIMWVALLVLPGQLAAFAGSAQTVAAKGEGLEKQHAVRMLALPARLSLEGATLSAALARLQQTSGVALAFSPSLLPPGRVVDCSCADATVGEALDRILLGTGFRYLELENQVLIEPATRPRPRASSVVLTAAVPAAGSSVQSAPTRATAPAEESAARNLVGTITGQVLESATRRPLLGVQVTAAGTGLGTLTDQTGSFRLTNVPAGPVTVRATMIGYETAEQTVQVVSDELVTIEFLLSQRAIALDEVVVTGTAGRQERRAQGAVIASVQAAEVVERAPITGVADILQGRVAGVSLTQGSGVSGTGQQIRIRGAASISISNEPLVYIDGLRVDSRLGAGDVSRLSDIDPSQIESIEVVKGPAAATLYGADASAGVIQIVTKKGTAGTGFQHRIETQYQSLEPGLDSWTNYGRCEAAQIADPELTLCHGAAPGTIVTDDPVRRYGVLRQGNVISGAWTMRGGGESYSAFSSLSRHEERGTLPSNEFERTSGRVNFSYFPRSNLEIGTNFSVTQTNTSLPTTGGSGFGHTIAMFAGSPITIGGPQNGLRHPYLDFDAIAQIDIGHVVTRFIPDLHVNYRATDWFSNRVILGVDASETERWTFYPRNDVGYYQRGRDEGEITEWRNYFRRFTLNYLGTLTRQHRGGWASMLSIGSEVLTESNDDMWAYGLGLTTNAARAVSSAAEVTGGQERTQDRRVGLFTQWEPSYRDRLYLQLGLRADKFSAFGSDIEWFMSPSARVSYVASDEPRLRAAIPEAVSSLRLRAAFGTTGRAPQSGASLVTYSPAPFTRENGSIGSGVVPLNPGNAQLRAEKGTEFETGFDAGLVGNRLGIEYTYFNKVTRDLILQVPQPPSLGFSAFPFQNIGKVRNSGHEVSLRATLLNRRAFGWEVSSAINTLSNQVLDLGGTAPFGSIRFEGTNRVAEGYPVGAFFTHRIRAFDVANNRAIVSDTLEFVGNLMPALEGNLSSTVRLPLGLSLYTHLDWKRDVRLYNTTAAFRDHSYANSYYAAHRDQLPAEERLRRFGPFFSESGEVVNRALVNEAYIEPADFLRLNEVSLTYELPSFLLRASRIQRASVQIGARNLRVWTDFTGLDPDVQNEFDAVAGRADFGSFPAGPRYTARVAVDF